MSGKSMTSGVDTMKMGDSGPGLKKASRMEKVGKLRAVLERSGNCAVMPCVGEALSAKMAEKHGFEVVFISGFAVAATHGLPDTGLLGMERMADFCGIINTALRTTPTIGDGDTGFGNAMNVKRTVDQYRMMGCAGIMIEDQVAPKRCGHTKGKDVVPHDEAFRRVRAACDARGEGEDIVILARTDANALLGFEEAIFRCKEFMRIGADFTFLEAPLNAEQMLRYCKDVPGPKLANMLEGGKTPILTKRVLGEMGFALAAHHATYHSQIKAIEKTLLRLKRDDADSLGTDDVDMTGTELVSPKDELPPFDDVKAEVGFFDYYKEYDRYYS